MQITRKQQCTPTPCSFGYGDLIEQGRKQYLVARHGKCGVQLIDLADVSLYTSYSTVKQANDKNPGMRIIKSHRLQIVVD